MGHGLTRKWAPLLTEGASIVNIGSAPATGGRPGTGRRRSPTTRSAVTKLR